MATADEEYLRGVKCEEEGRPTDALGHYARALALRSDHAPAHNNIGVIRQQQGDLAAAVSAYEKAIEADPRFGLAWYNLGNCWRETNRLEEATQYYRRALALAPADDETRINLASVLRDLRQFDEALALLGEVPLESEHAAKAEFNRGLVHLLRGDLGHGWDAYEQRLRFGEGRRSIPANSWNGTPLRGRSIFVHSEQGIGDQVMFASCLPDLLKEAGPSFVECDPRLVPLFARSFPQ